MIVDKIHQVLAKESEKRFERPNPTGSKLGACTAHLQHLCFPDLTRPDPWGPRSILVMEAGKQHERWLGEYIGGIYKKRMGLQQQPFFFPVPIPDERTADIIEDRLRRDRDDRTRTMFWGWRNDDFKPPRLIKKENGSYALKGQHLYDHNKPERDQIPPSVVLDRQAMLVYVVTRIDAAVDDPQYGLTVVEQKDMSDFGFRRAMLGDVEYRYRCQLLASTLATGFENAIWICLRKHTNHLCEIHFSKRFNRVRVTLTAPNGSQDVYFVANALKGLVQPATNGAPRQLALDDVGTLAQPAQEPAAQPVPSEALWDVAETWTPYSDADLASIHARILAVLTVQAPPLADPKTRLPILPPVNWFRREYGPTFTCLKCAGAGRRRCGYCKGTGMSARTKKPTQCSRCRPGGQDAVGVLGSVRCSGCNGLGHLDKVQLPAYPCGYCSTVMFCYGPAKVERIIGRRPEHWVRYDDYVASGIEFFPPEAAAVIDPEDEAEDEVAVEMEGEDA